MTLPCSKWCPFSACLACPWQGGKAPEPQRDTRSSECDETGPVWENWDTSGPRKFAPPEGLTTSPTKEI